MGGTGLSLPGAGRTDISDLRGSVSVPWNLAGCYPLLMGAEGLWG